MRRVTAVKYMSCGYDVMLSGGRIGSIYIDRELKPFFVMNFGIRPERELLLEIAEVMKELEKEWAK